MTTLPTTPKVKTLLETTPTLEKWESKTLAWVHLLTDVPMPEGYKPSTKYPMWGWMELTALPTAPTQDTPTTSPEVLRDAFGPLESLDTTPPADLTTLAPDFSTTRAALISGEANDMIDELLAGHVELVPAPEPKHAGHMIRQTSNPDWYRALYKEGYTKDACLNALARIVEGKANMNNRYDCRLLNIIENDRLPAVLANYPHLVITQ